MIIDTLKYLFIGAKEDLDLFFERAQEKGCIEFIAPAGKRPIDFPTTIQNLFSALKILRKLPVKKPFSADGNTVYADESALKIVHLKQKIEKHEEQLRLLQGEIARVGVFGDFFMDDIEYIEREGKRLLQFFCMKTAKRKRAEISDELIYIGTEYDLDYFVAINEEPKSYPDMIEMRIDRPLGELQNLLAFQKDMKHQLEAELKGYAGFEGILQEALALELDEFYLSQAKKEASYPMESSLFSIEAWVPANKNAELRAILDHVAVHGEQIAPEVDDRIPTYMENQGIAKIGEDVVKIYDIPSTTDKDPSLWILSAFTLFFAIIVADAGYGLIFLTTALYLRFKFPNLKGAAKRSLKLFTMLASACIVWGVLTGAYFGLNFSSDSIFEKTSIIRYLAEKKADYHIEAKDSAHSEWISKQPALANATSGKEFIEDSKVITEFSNNILLELSLFLGAVHISLSFLRYLRRNWAGAGWILFLIGGYLYFPYSLHATSMMQFLGLINKATAGTVGIQMIYVGLGSAVVLALIQKRLKGLGEIANVIQVFADALSYLRLYALALASTIMAETFNTMGYNLGYFLGALVVFLGHTVNIVLGTAGGVIHGLRLNFLEWYHYSFEGGGRLLKPLKKLKRSDQ
ncbi:MAG: V-type ATPase 116kDa subunit family protein [Chlamydiota bacterium]